jgi:C-terminal processing protease CtpA/Prc
MAKTPTLLTHRPISRRSILTARALIASCGVFLVGSLGNAALAQEAPPPKITLDALTPETVDERMLDNLVAWARLGGYLHHFNPSEWAWTTNMMAYLRDGFDPVVQARTPEELASVLDRLAQAVAPASLVWVSTDERPPLPDLKKGARSNVTAVIAWRHEGYTPAMSQEGPFFSRRVIYNMTAREALTYGFAPDNAYETDLPGGVRVRVPHTNFMDTFGNTLPNPTPRDRLRRDWPNTWNYALASERLAAVSFAWGLIQNFHPMIDRESLDVDGILRNAMLDALAANDRASMTSVVERLLAAFGDAQAEAWDPSAPIPGVPQFDALVIDGALMVTGVDQSLAQADIAAGDEILSIDGVKTSEALADARARYGSVLDETRDAHAVRSALSGFPASPIELSIRKPGGAVRSVTLRRDRPIFYAIDDGKEPIREVAPGIVYVDGARVTDADVFKQAALTLSAPGIIFDLRSPYTQLGMTTLGWVASMETRASDQFIHSPMHPDYNLVHVRHRDARVAPNPSQAIGKVVFLVGPETRGDAEFAALTMQDLDLGIVVGSHTAGAPGRPAAAVLPGGLQIQWTGLESRALNGTKIFGRGVPPDIEVATARNELGADTDPALDRAIEALNEYFDSLDQPTPSSTPAP